MTDLHVITPHAVIRFLERVMGLPIAPEIWRAHDGGARMTAAQMACEGHGLTIDQVRALIVSATPMIGAIIKAGCPDTKILGGDFAYIFRQGFLVTIVFKWMRDDRMKDLLRMPEGKRERQREAHKAMRRRKKKRWADDRGSRLLEGA